MATNAIGTGAVVLTANADRLLAGLDRAEKATGSWAKKTERVIDGVSSHAISASYARLFAKGAKLGKYMDDVDYTKPIKKVKDAAKDKDKSKGGLIGGLLFGGGVGLALAGVSAVSGAVGHLAEMLSTVGERAAQYGGISTERFARINRAQQAFDRITAAGDDFLFRVAEKLGPVIEKLATVLEVVGAVGGAAFGQLVTSTGRALSLIGGLVGITNEFGDAGESATQRTFTGLRNVAIGLAKVEQLLGNLGNFGLDSVFSTALQPLALQFKLLDKIAGTNVSGLLATKFDKVREPFNRASVDSTADINKWFDAEQKKYEAADRIRKSSGSLLSGAFGAGTNEAYSVLAKFQATNMIGGKSPADNPVAIAKEQLKEAKERKRALYKIVGELGRGTLIKAIP